MSTNDRDRIIEILETMDICLMATFDNNGDIHSRPMAMLRNTNSHELSAYFFIRKNSMICNELQVKSDVHLGYMNPNTHLYITFKGRGEESYDMDLRESLWSSKLNTWFPNGPTDPELMLIKVELLEAQCWDSISTRLINLTETTKSLTEGPIRGDDQPSSHEYL